MPPIFRSSFCFNRSQKPTERPSFDLSLYLVANRPSFKDESLFFSKIMGAVKGGVTCVQLRDHTNDYAKTLKTAFRLKKILKDVPLFINTLNPFELAHAIKAEGVFLEQKIPYSEARRLLGPKGIIGIPIKTMDEFLAVGQTHEIDYLSVKIAPSKRTCPRNDEIWGMEGLRRIRSLSTHRIVAIGGLHLACIAPVYQELHFNDGIAMAGGLMDEENPFIIAQKIQSIRKNLLEPLKSLEV